MADIVQGSEEWHMMRCGKVTASRVPDVISRTKSGWGTSRATYMGELIAERLTGIPAVGFSNTVIQRGNDVEPEARAAYAFFCNAPVAEVAFVDHPTIGMSGASPDGLVGDEGLVEFKCPNTSTHFDTLLGKYVTQMQWQMACTGRVWCDFVSFVPRMPEEMKMHVQRVLWDGEGVAELEHLVREFQAELEAKISALKEAA